MIVTRRVFIQSDNGFFSTKNSFHKFLVILLAAIFFSSAWSVSLSAAVVYVDKDSGGGNGSSWAQAYNSLEAAVSGTSAAADFWIAEGTYTPSATIILGLNQNHKFYGGFAGNETALNQRNVTAHPTIISGQGILKHVFNVTSLVNNVRFDGLTITGGNANAASGDDASGGGIVVNQGAVVIAYSTFTNNFATHLGGAVYLVNNPSVTITNSTFTNNTVVTGGGAGVAVTKSSGGSEPTPAAISKCTFQGNTGGFVGGGLYSLHYPITVTQSTFVGNASENGGAIMMDYKLSGPDTIERCIFANNTSTERGGAICSYARSVEVENCVFSNNSASLRGGAVGMHSGYNNATLYNPNYRGTFRNSVFYSNQAATLGGGIDNIGDHRMYIYNSIFWSNQAPNTVFQDGANRSTDDIANPESSTMDMFYTDMESWGQPDSPVAVNAAGNFSQDPLFVDPNGDDNVLGTADDNLSITYSSPCIDRADGNNAAATDFEFRVREDYPTVPNQGIGTPNYGDIGAFEGPSSGSPTPPPPPPPVPDGINMSPVIYLLTSTFRELHEDFEGTWPPIGWKVVDNAGTGMVWDSSDSIGSTNWTTFGSGFAAGADSYVADPTHLGMDTELWSPPIKLRSISAAFLGYASNFQDFAGNGEIWLDISTDFGLSWTNIRYQTIDDPPNAGNAVGGTWEVEDLTPYIGNTVILRWRYATVPGSWGWYWYIDSVAVQTTPPTP